MATPFIASIRYEQRPGAIITAIHESFRLSLRKRIPEDYYLYISIGTPNIRPAILAFFWLLLAKVS